MFDDVWYSEVSDYAASKAFFLKALEPLGMSKRLPKEPPCDDASGDGELVLPECCVVERTAWRGTYDITSQWWCGRHGPISSNPDMGSRAWLEIHRRRHFQPSIRGFVMGTLRHDQFM